MKMNNEIMKILISVILLLSFTSVSYSLPLSTQSKWIVDSSTGKRVKLTCANWAGHLEPMLPEGLHKRPLYSIARHVNLMGFNCIRLTWATHMFTRYSNLTVLQSFKNLGYDAAIEGLKNNNPDILDLTLVNAQKAVIKALEYNRVMVILDNQVSKPMWCCGDDDGNGFFGDKYFDTQEWLAGLHIVATQYRDTPFVVGMSLRNELRGSRQNENDWYKYVQRGALTVYNANPNVLILISGQNYDIDFSLLKTKPLELDLPDKLVYEAHRYSFTEGQQDKWLNQPINQVCKSVLLEVYNKTGFLREGPNAAPLFISEFGIDARMSNPGDNLFMSCFLAYLVETDLDWALWSLQGSYYHRDGNDDAEETYGILNGTWTHLRNPVFHERLQMIRQMTRDPYTVAGSSNKILYHPLSGRCIKLDKEGKLHPGDCLDYGCYRWSFSENRAPIQLAGTNMCLRAHGEGLPVTLDTNCNDEQTMWECDCSGGMFQIANEDPNGNKLCFDWDSNYSTRILTKKCICDNAEDTNCLNDPQSQWFQWISVP